MSRALVLGLLISAASAFGQSAAELKKLGDAAMQNKLYDDAIAHYLKSYAQKPDAAVLYNLSRATQSLGRFGESLAWLERFEKEAPRPLRAKVPDLEGLKAELASRVHTLTLRIAPEGAEVFLDGARLGSAPLEPAMRVNAGSRQLEVRAEGFVTVQRKLELAGNASSDVEVKLEGAATDGVLLVTARPAEARVTVDERPPSGTPLELSLRAGPHRVRIELEGYVSTDASLLIEVGARRTLDVTLEPVRSVFSRWWFWTAIGVVVAGAVTGTVLALTLERDPSVGSLMPGQQPVGRDP